VKIDTGFLFGVFHIYPGKILSTAILGMLFAYVVAKTGSILAGMFLHFINNIFSIIISGQFIKYQNNIEIMGIVGILMVIVCINGLWWFYRNLKNKISG